MPNDSPISHPGLYVDRVNRLSAEGITIDKGVGQAKRDAADFATKYSADFKLVIELKTITEQFSDRWVAALLQTRDAASSISAWYLRFDQVFLSLINDIASEQDAKDVVSEFNSLLGERHPSEKYELDGAPGVKQAFTDIEALVPNESEHVIKILQTNPWETAVELLQERILPVKGGISQIRTALNNYATQVE